jgi:hypothetical protein
MGYYAMIDDGGLNNGGFGSRTRAIDLLRPPAPAPPASIALRAPAPAAGNYLPAQGPTVFGKGVAIPSALGGTGAKMPSVFSPAGASRNQLTEQHRQWFQFGDYSYENQNWLGLGLEQFGADEIARVFREHPGEIFPFGVQGCSTLTNGASCRLVDAVLVPSGDGSGTVDVKTTATSVTFTVTSNDYFDAPGSTIRFDIVKRRDGYYLDQTAKATGANIAVAATINVLGAHQVPWSIQSENLRRAVFKYGQK